MRTHKRHAEIDTEVLVQCDIGMREVQNCLRTLDRYTDQLGDVTQLRHDLNTAGELFCSIADFAKGGREINDPALNVISRYGFMISAIALMGIWRDEIHELIPPGWFGITVAFVVIGAAGIGFWLGLGWLSRHFEYRLALRNGALPSDPRQESPTTLARSASDWVRTAPYDRERYPDQRGKVLTGIAWAMTGFRRPEDSHLPAGHMSMRLRLDGVRWQLNEAAARTRRRKALDLYTRANFYVERLDAVLCRAVEDICCDLDTTEFEADASATGTATIGDDTARDGARTDE